MSSDRQVPEAVIVNLGDEAQQLMDEIKAAKKGKRRSVFFEAVDRACQFRPQFESPLERDAYHQIQIFAPRGLATQVSLLTGGGTFRPDILVPLPDGQMVAVEVDGEEFHRDSLRDALRTALLFETGEIHHMIRLSGKLVWHAEKDIVCIMHALFPEHVREFPWPDSLFSPCLRELLADVQGRRWFKVQYLANSAAAAEESKSWFAEVGFEYASAQATTGHVAALRRLLRAYPIGDWGAENILAEYQVQLRAGTHPGLYQIAGGL